MATKAVREVYQVAQANGYRWGIEAWCEDKANECLKLERKYRRLTAAALDLLERLDMPKGNVLGFEDGNGNSLDPIVRRLAKLVDYPLKEADDGEANRAD